MSQNSCHTILESLAAQLENASFPVVLCDADLQVQFQNKYARENVPALRYPILIPNLISQEQLDSYRKRLWAGESFQVETTSGVLLDTFVSFSPLMDEKTCVGALITLVPNANSINKPSDLTSNSAAILSAGFRQPLTDIFAALSVINRNLQAQGNRTLDEYLQTINRSSYRILRNTNNIISRMSSFFAYRRPPEVVDFWERMAELLEASAIVLRSADIHLDYQLPESPALVRCDFPSISTAFVNLLSNACRHGCKDGNITVTGKVLGTSAMVTVMDEGSGISQELAERIFAPYAVQGDGGVPYGGLGLGLAVAKQIIQEAGGTIAVDSVVGEFTKVVFNLPMVQDAAPSPRISLESGSVVYLRDRFSPVYVGLCDVVPPPEQ